MRWRGSASSRARLLALPGSASFSSRATRIGSMRWAARAVSRTTAIDDFAMTPAICHRQINLSRQNLVSAAGHAPDGVAHVVGNQEPSAPVDGDAYRPSHRVAVLGDEPREHVNR